MTLFAEAAGTEPVFQQVLDTFFAGERDPRTVDFLDSWTRPWTGIQCFASLSRVSRGR